MATQLVAAGTAAAVNVLAARALDPSGRGTLALLLQIAYLSSQGLLLGTDRSLTAVYEGLPPRTVARASLRLLVVPACVTALVVCALVLIPMRSLDAWRSVLIVTGAFTIVNAFVRAARAVAIATGQQAGYVRLVLVSQALLLVAVGVLFLAGVDDVLVWLLAYPLAGGLPTLLHFGRLVRGHRPRLRAAADARRTRTRKEGLVLVPAAVANTGMLRADRFVLPVLSSTAALGLYASVATMTELLTWPLQAYADSRLGRWRAADECGRLSIGKVLVVALIYTIVSGAALGVATYNSIVPLFGPAYEPARALVTPLVLAAGIYGLAQVAVTLLIARRRNVLASAAEGAGFAVSMVAYVLLIPTLGPLGAAYGSAVGYGTSLLVSCSLLWRHRRSTTVGTPGRGSRGEGGAASP